MSIQQIKTRLRERIEASDDRALLEAVLASLEAVARGDASAEDDGLTDAQGREAMARLTAHQRHPDESTSLDWESLRDESPD